MSFKFGLNEKVAIVCSREQGVVVGRAEYVHSDKSYLVRYMAADGRAVEQWWCESALSNDADLLVDFDSRVRRCDTVKVNPVVRVGDSDGIDAAIKKSLDQAKE